MALTNNTSGISQSSTLDCCGDCETPIILTELFQGQSLIPFSLNMADGTTVEEIHTANQGKVLNGRGVIEVEPLRFGQLIELKVKEPKCEAISCVYVVNNQTDCTSCGERPICDIKIKTLTFGIVAEIYGTITELEVESYSPVEYQITDNDLGTYSEWTSNWKEIPLFELNRQHTLTLRSDGCESYTNIYVEKKMVNVPTTVYQNVPVTTPVSVFVPSQVVIPTPNTVYVGVPNNVPTPVAVLVNIPTITVVPTLTPVYVGVPVTYSVPTLCPTPVAVPTSTPTPVSVPVGSPVALLNAQITIIKRPSCFNGTDGNLGLKVTGGTAPYTYAWTRNGVTVSSPTSKNRGFGNNSGLWQVVITDNVGQTITKSVSLIAENTNNLSFTNSTTDPTSDVSNDGAITVNGTGATSPYSYYWLDNQSTSNARTGLDEGSYYFMIIDSKGCLLSIFALAISSSVAGHRISYSSQIDIRNCTHGSPPTQSLLTLVSHSAAGETSYTYLWSNGSTSQELINPIAGSYEVTVTGNLGNVATITGIVHTVAPATLMNISTTNSSGGLANGSITITSLSNMIGTVQTSHYLNTTTNEYYTNPSALKTGSYTITVFTDYGERITRTGVSIL